jgi:hypothetical protein
LPRKDAKRAKFGKIKVWAAKKNGWVAGPLRAWRLGGKIDPKITSRKDAKDAKFGKIKVEAAKTNGLGGGAFASLASLRPCSGHAWREKKSED